MWTNKYKEDALKWREYENEEFKKGRAKVLCSITLVNESVFEFEHIKKATSWINALCESRRTSARKNLEYDLQYNHWLQDVMLKGIELEGAHYSPHFIRSVTYGEIEEYEV